MNADYEREHALRRIAEMELETLRRATERAAAANASINIEKASESCTNPLLSAAVSLLQLEAPARELDPSLVQGALKHQAEQIRQNDLSGVETMLAAQAQMLHTLFAQAVEKYASGGKADACRSYGNIALKAQSCCRMTVDAITRLRAGQQLSARKTRKIEEPAIKEASYEAMDGGGAPASGGTDPAVAAVENGGA